MAPSVGVSDGTVVLEGRFLHYREAGRDGSAAAVVLHGIMGSTREWDGLVDVLSPTFHVFALDQRGHGESDWARDYSGAALARDVLHFLDAMEIHRAHLIGHSMGAIAAALVAADAHERVDRVVLMDISPGSLSTPFAALLPDMLEHFATASYHDPEEALEEWAAANPLAQRDHLARYIDHALVRDTEGTLRYRFDAGGLIQFVREGVTEDELWRAIDAITAPTLLIRGELSDVFSSATAARVVRRLANAMLIEIRDAGHDLGVEQPEAVAAVTSAFLTQGDDGT